MSSTLSSTLFGTKDEAKTSLRFLGILLIGLALISIFSAIVSFASGEMYGQAFTAIESVGGITLEVSSFAQGLSTSILVIAIVLGLIEIYVGYKGLREASGVKQGGGYLVLVTIYLVLVTISFIAIFINAIRTPGGFDDWFSVFSPLADIVIASWFLGSAKTLRAGNKK